MRMRIDGPLVRFGRRPDPSMRLFCLPYAGGSATIYRPWAAALPDTVEVIGVELPGRGTRRNDAPAVDLRTAAASLASEVERLSDIPFVLFGHSMGGLLAYELALRLREMPTSLVVSACPSPHQLTGRPQRHRLPDADLLAEIALLDGTPQAVLNGRDMMALTLGTIRADLAMFETYEATAPRRLPCDIAALCGQSDRSVGESDVAGWAAYTTAQFSTGQFAGGHFFIKASQSSVIAYLACHLTPPAAA